MTNRLWRWTTIPTLAGTYLRRLPLIKLKYRLYLHQICGYDPSPDAHDHPCWMVVIGLKGWYAERPYDRVSNQWGPEQIYQAPFVRWFPATYAHRICGGKAWTLVIQGPHRRPWGFFTREGFRVGRSRSKPSALHNG